MKKLLIIIYVNIIFFVKKTIKLIYYQTFLFVKDFRITNYCYYNIIKNNVFIYQTFFFIEVYEFKVFYKVINYCYYNIIENNFFIDFRDSIIVNNI